MKALEKIVSLHPFLSGYSIKNIYPSKKNTVACISNGENQKVIKYYHNNQKNALNHELSILKYSNHQLHIPTLLDYDINEKIILMDKIPGQNLCDVLNDNHLSQKKKARIITAVSSWFYIFHQFFKKKDKYTLRGDAILRNFIVTSEKIYSVDFEDIQIGQPITDLAEFCASLLTTTPQFTIEKYRLCKLFITQYQKHDSIELPNIENEINEKINQMYRRRNSTHDTIS